MLWIALFGSAYIYLVTKLLVIRCFISLFWRRSIHIFCLKTFDKNLLLFCECISLLKHASIRIKMFLRIKVKPNKASCIICFDYYEFDVATHWIQNHSCLGCNYINKYFHFKWECCLQYCICYHNGNFVSISFVGF